MVFIFTIIDSWGGGVERKSGGGGGATGWGRGEGEN